MNQLFWTTVISGGLLAGTPLMFTALGESISERAGVLNIGLEGMMLVGAYCGYLGAHYGHSVWVGYLTGILGGMSGALIMAVLCVRLGLDQIVVGIAITLAGEGITSVLYQNQFSSTQPRLGAAPSDPIPLLDQIPILGKPLNGQDPLFSQSMIVYLGLAFAALLAWIFRSTNIGLNLRAAGEKPEALDAAGVSVARGAFSRSSRRGRASWRSSSPCSPADGRSASSSPRSSSGSRSRSAPPCRPRASPTSRTT